MKKYLYFILMFFLSIGNSFSYEGLVNELVEKDYYRIIYKNVDHQGQFHFILQHKKRKDILICTSAIRDMNEAETICGEP